MLASIRRQQKWLLIVVAAIIIVAFAWLYNQMDYDQPTMMEAFTLYDRKYRVSEAQRLMRTNEICYRLGLYEFVTTLERRQQGQDRNLIEYAINLIILREQAKRMGIEPTQDGIAEFVKELPAFRTNGQYNPESFKTFTEDILNPSGFALTDLYQIAADALSFEKLQDLVAANVHADSDDIDELFNRQHTAITASRIDFPRTKFSESVQVTDEEINTYYEQNKANLTSPPKRGIEYVAFLKPEKTEEMSDEEFAAKNKEFGEKVNKFALDVLAEGANFAALAQKHGVEIKRPEPFSLSEPPEDLEGNYQLVSDIFRRTLAVPISDPFNTEDGYYIYNLLSLVEPQPLTLEEAKPQIAERLESSSVSTRMSEAASKAQTDLQAALAGGTSFADAAKAAGLEVKELQTFSLAQPPIGEPDAQTVAGIGSNLDAGEISSVLSGAGGAFLVYVKEKKELSDESAQTKKDEIADQLSRFDHRLLFEAWFQKVKVDAGALVPTGDEVAAQ